MSINQSKSVLESSPAFEKEPGMRRWIKALVSLALASVLMSACQTNPRPNFIVIISDDQRYDSMRYMPITQLRIFDRGITFDRAYVTTSLCCPSRSSILTGL